MERPRRPDAAAPLSERALQRRLKRHLLKTDHDFFAVCAPGFEAELAAEIARLPEARPGASARGGVAFSGPLDLVYHANLELRTAHRVLLRVSDFLAQSFPMLYGHVTRVPWELYLGFAEAYSIAARARRSRLNLGARVEETVADGIAAALEPLGLRPEARPGQPLSFRARLDRDRCTLSFDTSGDHLHRRGYRTHVGEAPMRETLAASVLLAAGVTGSDLVVDPFCGSGTLLTEAASLVEGRPLNGQRSFAFEHAPFFAASKWERLKAEAAAAARPPGARFLGFDLASSAVAAAERNVERAGLESPIAVRQRDALELDLAELRDGARSPLLVANPPYGGRLGSRREAEALLRRFLEAARSGAPGWRYALVTPRPDLLEEAGMTPDRVVRTTNGGIAVAVAIGTVPERNGSS